MVSDEKRNIGLDKPKRNKFDLSKNTHIGVQFGRITPFYSKLMIPGDSFRITTRFGVRFQPMVYPIASKVHGYTSWYFVPFSALWKRDSSNRKGGWREFITDANTRMKGVASSKKYTFSFPYINQSNPDFWRTGSLADYLGVPTTLPNSEYVPFVTRSGNVFGLETLRASGHIFEPDKLKQPDITATPLDLTSVCSNYPVVGNYLGATFYGSPVADGLHSFIQPTATILLRTIGLSNSSATFSVGFALSKDNKEYVVEKGNNKTIFFTATSADNVVTVPASTRNAIVSAVNSYVENGQYVKLVIGCSSFSNEHVLAVSQDFKGFASLTISSIESTGIVDAVDMQMCPFMANSGESAPNIPVSALPFRAYEAIYNAYYRRVDIDPYTDPRTGVVNYDTFCDTREGADTNNYDFHYKRLVTDMYTGADPVPVWYDSPIVNIVNTNNDDSVVTLTVTGWNKDPQRQDSFQVKLSEDDNKVEIDKNAESNEDIFKILKSSLGSGTGITMRDFQNARAMEIYLSACMRIGAGYSTYLQKIHGTDAGRDDDFAVNVPRYLGGTSCTIDVQQLTSTSETEQKALGDYIGMATMGDSGKISCYAGEHGIIMGVFTLIPEVADSNHLGHEFMIPVNELSYPSKEFLHLQEQPIRYSELCPIVAYKDYKANSSLKTSDTFAYNDAWIDYKEDHDDVHGLFRKEYADYVVSRNYGVRPVLNADFCTCNPDTLTDPFSVSHKNGDIGVCHVNLQVEAVRPLPRAVLPTI